MQHLEAANRSFVVESRNYVFAVLTAGPQYCRVTLTFLLSSVVVPSRSYFYEIQAQMVGSLWCMTNDSMKKALSKIKTNTIFKIDGAWDHRRNGKACFVTFFDSRRDKIIHCEVAELNHGKVKVNFGVASKNMESLGIERAIQKLKENHCYSLVIKQRDGFINKNLENPTLNLHEWSPTPSLWEPLKFNPKRVLSCNIKYFRRKTPKNNRLLSFFTKHFNYLQP